MLEESGSLIAAWPHRNHRTIDKASIDSTIVADSYILWVAKMSIVRNDCCVLEELRVDVLEVSIIQGVNRENGSLVARVVLIPLCSFVNDPSGKAQDQGQAQLKELRYHLIS